MLVKMPLIRNILRTTAARRFQWIKSSSFLIPRRLNSSNSNDAKLLDVALVLAKPEELKEKEKLSKTISVPIEGDLSSILGVPSHHVKTRRVRIHRPPKNAMQSGTDNINRWLIEFDCRQRWENPLMGWISTGDPLSNSQVEFNSPEEAIRHCEKNGWKWFVDGEVKPKKQRVKNYAVNFSWNKRTRVSTK